MTEVNRTEPLRWIPDMTSLERNQNPTQVTPVVEHTRCPLRADTEGQKSPKPECESY